jgi:hypothetical protein
VHQKQAVLLMLLLEPAAGWHQASAAAMAAAMGALQQWKRPLHYLHQLVLLAATFL